MPIAAFLCTIVIVTNFESMPYKQIHQHKMDIAVRVFHFTAHFQQRPIKAQNQDNAHRFNAREIHLLRQQFISYGGSALQRSNSSKTECHSVLAACSMATSQNIHSVFKGDAVLKPTHHVPVRDILFHFTALMMVY